MNKPNFASPYTNTYSACTTPSDGINRSDRCCGFGGCNDLRVSGGLRQCQHQRSLHPTRWRFAEGESDCDERGLLSYLDQERSSAKKLLISLPNVAGPRLWFNQRLTILSGPLRGGILVICLVEAG
jgi:hypothetical protein